MAEARRGPGPQPPDRRLRRIALVLLVLVVTGCAMLLAGRWATRQSLLQSAARGNVQLGLYAGAMQAFIDRHRMLPILLSLDPELGAALAGPIDDRSRAQLNARLETVNSAARTATLTLLDRDGIGVAANNWREPGSNVGVDYRFRPYFRQAIQEGSGRFYGIGITTGQPGYYMAEAVRDARGQYIGAVNVKVDLGVLERDWARSDDVVLVSDAHGIVFLGNRPDWRYRLLRPLQPADLDELAQSQQYGHQPLLPVALQRRPFSADGEQLTVGSAGLQGDYLAQTLALPAEGWTLHLLHPRRGSVVAGRVAALAAGGALLSLLFLGLLLQQRLRLSRLRQRSRAELEQLVRQHAEALHSARDGVVLAAERARIGERQSLEHLPQGVSVIDAELRLTAWNRRYVEIFGYPPELIRVGRPIEDLLRYNARRGLLGNHDVDDAVQRRLEHLRAGRPHMFEREWADGTVLEIRGNPLPGGGFVTSYADITAYRNTARELRTLAVSLERRVDERTRDLDGARREAERANRSKTSFVSAAVHDLLQPLNAARMYTSALRERLGEHPATALADHIEEALVAEDSILSSLLDISRLESGALQTQVQDLALQDLFDTLRREFEPSAAARGLGLRVVATRAVVRSDAALLRRILQNFLSNALRYTARGNVLMGLRRAGDGHLRIEVWDTGCGIAEAHHAAIFEEFRRLDGGADPQDRGAGLGLAIVERIARRLNHRIGLRSWPGQGSVFSVELPRGDRQALAVPRALAPEPATALQDRHIWCIDDDPRVREAARALLEAWGCEVTLLGSAEAALASTTGTPDLVLLDHRLGSVTGAELMPSLFARWGREPPVIVISAEREAASEVAATAGWAFLPKPVRPPALRALMRQLLLRSAGDDPP